MEYSKNKEVCSKCNTSKHTIEKVDIYLTFPNQSKNFYVQPKHQLFTPEKPTCKECFDIEVKKYNENPKNWTMTYR